MWGNVKSFPTQNPHKMTAKEQIQRITDIAREKGWSVSIEEDKSQSNILFEFQRFTKYGQDFLFNADMHGEDIDTLIAGIKEYYEGLSPIMKPTYGLAMMGMARMAHLITSRIL